MKFVDYAPLALRTAKPHPHDHQVMHAQIGMVTELGEFCDAIKRHAIYGKPLDVVNCKEEIADFFWYFNLYCHEQKISAFDIDTLLLVEIGPQAYSQWDMVKSSISFSTTVCALLVPLDVRGVSDFRVIETLMMQIKQLAVMTGVDIYAALDRNIEKLNGPKGRYKESVFTEAESIARDVVAERKILEGGNG